MRNGRASQPLRKLVIAHEEGQVNGNPLYHWIGPAVSTVLMLPVPVAMLAGWTPP